MVVKSSSNAASFHASEDDVFGRIASRYDFLCDLFSVGLHRIWKRRVASLISQESWSNLLDAAAGTGDVVLRVAQKQGLEPHQKIVVSDISHQMLAIAKRRAHRYSSSVEYQILDAHSMPTVVDASVDLYSISLGLKICDRTRVLREAIRVLRPGGRIVILEASNIPWKWLHRAYLSYMSLCMPCIGWVATGGDSSAYRYLLSGIEAFPSAEALALELREVGFQEVLFERLSLGIVALHIARKPRQGIGQKS